MAVPPPPGAWPLLLLLSLLFCSGVLAIVTVVVIFLLLLEYEFIIFPFRAGCQKRFRIGCKRRREYGYSYVPGVLTFETEDGEEFHILRFLSVRIVSDLYDDLKQTSEYRPPQRAAEIPRNVVTTRGIPLPP